MKNVISDVKMIMRWTQNAQVRSDSRVKERTGCKDNSTNIKRGLELWCLTPLSTIFKLIHNVYRGGQFHW